MDLGVSERLTGALLDRLTHHVHILEMNGESFQLATSKKTIKQTRNPSIQGGQMANTEQDAKPAL